MANLFTSTDYPEQMPDELIAGDRWAWKRTDLGVDYPPASYALSYELRLESTGTSISLTASESGADYLVEVASATTAAYTAGEYAWDAYITRSSDSERVRIETGTVEVLPDRSASDADPRSHAKKMLDAIQATLESRATSDQMSYSISTGTGSRSLARMSPDELMRWEGFYRHRWMQECAKRNAARGRATGRKIMMRFK